MTPTNTAATKAGDLLDWRELAPVAALLRTHECFTDDEDTDIGRDKLDALTAFGWLEKVGRAKWMITALGERIVDRALAAPPAETALAASDAGDSMETRYAKRLAHHLWASFYREDAPQWECLPDMMGVLTQIDNMIAGLERSQARSLCVRPRAVPDTCSCPQHGNWIAADDVKRLTRELDVALNGGGAAKQASLCDVVAQVMDERWKLVRTAEQSADTPRDICGRPAKLPTDPDDYV